MKRLLILLLIGISFAATAESGQYFTKTGRKRSSMARLAIETANGVTADSLTWRQKVDRNRAKYVRQHCDTIIPETVAVNDPHFRLVYILCCKPGWCVAEIRHCCTEKGVK